MSYHGNEEDGEIPSHSSSSYDSRPRSSPDHGNAWMPGADGDTPDAAPESLDHFKRGYRERVEMRERGLSGLKDKQ